MFESKVPENSTGLPKGIKGMIDVSEPFSNLRDTESKE